MRTFDVENHTYTAVLNQTAAKEFFGGESGMAGKLLAQTQQIEKHAADQITALKKSTYALSSNYSRYGSSAYDGSTSGYKYNARG